MNENSWVTIYKIYVITITTNRHSTLVLLSAIVSIHCKQISTSLFGERILWLFGEELMGHSFLKLNSFHCLLLSLNFLTYFLKVNKDPHLIRSKTDISQHSLIRYELFYVPPMFLLPTKNKHIVSDLTTSLNSTIFQLFLIKPNVFRYTYQSRLKNWGKRF